MASTYSKKRRLMPLVLCQNVLFDVYHHLRHWKFDKLDFPCYIQAILHPLTLDFYTMGIYEYYTKFSLWFARIAIVRYFIIRGKNGNNFYIYPVRANSLTACTIRRLNSRSRSLYCNELFRGCPNIYSISSACKTPIHSPQSDVLVR